MANNGKNGPSIQDFFDRLARDFFMSYDWPFFLNIVCEARQVPRSEDLTPEEFHALTHAANVTVQMCGFDWDVFMRYVQNVRDYFAYRGCGLKKLEVGQSAYMNEAFMKAMESLYIDLTWVAGRLQFEKRFANEELRGEVISFVARLFEKGYVFA